MPRWGAGRSPAWAHGTVQVIEPFSVAEQIRIEDRDPEPADIGELLARVRGAEAGPPAFPKLLPAD